MSKEEEIKEVRVDEHTHMLMRIHDYLITRRFCGDKVSREFSF
jgi:hypothetical protein